MTEEELMKKIDKEEKWLVNALKDRTDIYCVDIAFDAVKHYIRDYIKSQQTTGRWIDSHIPESTLCECSECGFTCGAYSFNYCPDCGAKMEVEDE